MTQRFYVSDPYPTAPNHWHGDTYWMVVDGTTDRPAKQTRFYSKAAAEHEAQRMSDPREEASYDAFRRREASLGADFRF